ncbi:PREDICTED: WAS/WASL-interacting protein family member 3 [Dipodomys ordii]|uniref:WAS/WASL-interacting protein family member 3 n=1 Tax=Dipodomys ordii TaxID=10020 RepID=A0A1S3FPF9_DIPOR|nr:PREDICTED: WAS/WASL-interacting protein family member 3 [Dipodomys ordii]
MAQLSVVDGFWRSSRRDQKKSPASAPPKRGCQSGGGGGGVRLRCWRVDSKPAGLGPLRSRPAWGLGAAGSVYTCHEGGEGVGGGRRRKPVQSPKLLHSSREAAGRWRRQARASPRRQDRDGLQLPRSEPGRASPDRAMRFQAPPAASPRPPRNRAEPEARRPAEPARSRMPGSAAGRCLRPGRGAGWWAGPGPRTLSPRAAGGAERPRLPGSSGAAAMGMAQGPGEELAPRGRTGYSDVELARAEGRLSPALSAQQRHGRPPGVSALPRDPHPTTLRPLPPPPPPPPPPRRPPPTPHTLPSCSGGTAAADTSLPGAGG